MMVGTRNVFRWQTDPEHIHELRVGVLNVKSTLPGAEFKIWPLKSAPEVIYFGKKIKIWLGFASPNLNLFSEVNHLWSIL